MVIEPSYVAASNLATAYFYLARYADSARTFERAIQMNDSDIASGEISRLPIDGHRRAERRGQPYERAAQMAERP